MRRFLLAGSLFLIGSFCSGCADVSEGVRRYMADEPGTQRINQIAENKFAMEIYGKATAGELYSFWEKKASEVCNGKYETIEREYTKEGVSYSGEYGRLVGVIECR